MVALRCSTTPRGTLIGVSTVAGAVPRRHSFCGQAGGCGCFLGRCCGRGTSSRVYLEGYMVFLRSRCLLLAHVLRALQFLQTTETGRRVQRVGQKGLPSEREFSVTVKRNYGIIENYRGGQEDLV